MKFAAVVALVCGILSWPLASLAQSAKLPRVGYLLPFSSESRTAPFLDGLRELGYVEGQNIITERRFAEGRTERYPALAAELVRLKVDVIVADGATATRAAQQATTTIPIVMIAADPVRAGFIASLPRPGGNITGLSTNSPALVGKRLEALKEALPRASRVAVLFNAGNPVSAFFVSEAEGVARVLGLQAYGVPVQAANEIEGAFVTMEKRRAEAVLVVEDPSLIGPQITQIAQLANKRRLPTMFGSNLYHGTGILMTYGPSYRAMFRRTAFYVDKILKGAKPAELPTEEPTTFELVINLKTAKALGLTIPQSLLLRADQVIQ